MNLLINHSGLASRISRKGRDVARRGVAAVEFALTIPIWILLFLGLTDTAMLLIQSERVDRISYSVTDIVTQSEMITNADLQNILSASSQLMNPFPFGARGAAIVSSIYKPAGQPATIKWQYTGGGTLTRGSRIGSVGATPILPNGLVLNDNENIVTTEVFYAYEPLFVNAGILAAHDLYRVAIYKPRLSPLINPPL